jgi:hypothetical protein
MATRIVKGASRPKSSQKSAATAPKIPQAQPIAQRERTKLKPRISGVRLSGAQGNLAMRALDDININSFAVFELALEAVANPDSAEWCCIAIQNIAKVGCRKADYIAGLLGEPHSFGNFEDEFTIPGREGKSHA